MEHAQPFYKLPTKTLLHVYKVTKHDEKQRYCKNRLYYLSEKLKVILVLLKSNYFSFI